MLALIISLVPMSAYAVEMHVPGETTNATAANTSVVIPPHKIGDCVEMLGGLWQQLSDGTWAEPNDRINTCKSGGNSGFNFGMIPGGLGGNSTLSGIAALLALNNSSNNIGNMTQAQWFQNCVLTQSIIARPECQGLSAILGNSGLMSNVGNSGILGSLANAAMYANLGTSTNSNAFFANIGDYGVAVNVPSKNEGLTKALSILSMGWSLSKLF